MEINIAASLIRKNVKFIKQESPDFTVPEYGVFIECGSSHKPNNSSKSLDAKIHSAIAVKSRKAYCNSATLLCIDITNIVAACEEKEIEALGSKENMHRAVQEMLRDTKSGYGSIILFSYVMENDIFYSNYWRVDNDTIKPTLLTFLDKYYPYGEVKLVGPKIGRPRAG